MGRYFYDGYRAPAEPPARAAMNPTNLGRLALAPALSPAVASRTGAVVFPANPHGICPAWGCGVSEPIETYTGAGATPVSSQSSPTPILNTTGSPGSTSAQSANTPVPVGYPTNSLYLATNGSLWAFSSTTGTWENVGTPYGVDTGAASTSTATASASSPNASTAAEVAGTPVPVGYPITSPYVDTQGNTWGFNSSTGAWVVTALSTTASASAVTATSTGAATAAQVSGTPVPVGTSNSSIYTDSSGNTWQFNTATGTWMETAVAASASFENQVAGWLGSSTNVFGLTVPNAVLAGVVVLGTALLMGRKK